MPRALLVSDFPSHFQLTLTPPPSSSPQLTNVLILLHGLGDTYTPFTELGKQLSLPETTCLSLQALTPLPFDLGGYHWGDDVQFNQADGNMEFDAGFEKSTRVLRNDVIRVLVEECGYQHREILFFGLGQGAMAALAVAASLTQELGGIISIGGQMPSMDLPTEGAHTPILVIGGSSDTLVTKTGIALLKTAFSHVEYHKWNRSGDGMPRNRDEMLSIMRFFARRLKSRKGAPTGSVEIL